ncbi:hypothetical protein [Leptospira ilyithenensis]|uniref:Lipoprotein n=1 Tax=Leptospira ilyithenensis TaxID=2484901 RepID=A0A4R9LTG2_9LEPT|nr:hypothetical protein [Leptospira ilyithenensis]TGN13750.1 hypothetical protein EHS11_03460 [Leptospira ilyithenensis]
MIGFRRTVILFLFLLIGCEKKAVEKKEEMTAVKKEETSGIAFEEKINNSIYNWSFFERVGGEECWEQFQIVNYEAFEARKNGPGPRQAVRDFVACSLEFYTLPGGTHIFNGALGGWFEESPKAITKLECNRNKCEMYFGDYTNGNPRVGKGGYIPRKGKFTFVILDSKHLELVNYPKDVLDGNRDIRGIYRYFPNAHDLPAEAFCQIDKDELLKNKDIYPPKELECINPDDARKAAENEEKE